jgi:hypothetical protein
LAARACVRGRRAPHCVRLLARNAYVALLCCCVRVAFCCAQFHLETESRGESALDAWRVDSTVAPLVLEVRRAPPLRVAGTLLTPTMQVFLLPHAPAAADAQEDAASMVLLERWTLAHERTAVDVGSPGSPSSLPRRPSLFESARSLEVPVIYKRTARAHTAASRCSRLALTRTRGTGDYAALALHIAAHAAGAPPVSSLQGAVACARCGRLPVRLMRCSCRMYTPARGVPLHAGVRHSRADSCAADASRVFTGGRLRTLRFHSCADACRPPDCDRVVPQSHGAQAASETSRLLLLLTHPCHSDRSGDCRAA